VESDLSLGNRLHQAEADAPASLLRLKILSPTRCVVSRQENRLNISQSNLQSVNSNSSYGKLTGVTRQGN
jgi:hypothetical protein